MKEVCIDIVSDERNPKLFPNTNSYSVRLNRPLYHVEKIELIAAQIPVTQTIINSTNNTFSMHDGTLIHIQNGNFSDGHEFSNVLKTSFLNTSVDEVNFDSNTSTLTFSNTSGSSFTPFGFNFYSGVSGFVDFANAHVGTPASVLGFNHEDTNSDSNILTSNLVDFSGPTSIIFKLSANKENLKKPVFVTGFANSNVYPQQLDSTESTYFGRLLTTKYDVQSKYLIYGGGYHIQDEFIKGFEKNITNFHISFYYSIGTKLIPYDFGNRNHTLKFKIYCSLDKLNVLKDQKVYQKQLPPPVKLPKLEIPNRFNKKQMIVFLFILIMTGMLFLMIFKQ